MEAKVKEEADNLLKAECEELEKHRAIVQSELEKKQQKILGLNENKKQQS